MSTHAPHARAPWTVLVLLCVAQFMVVLDITVVNVALPSIGADLGFAASDLQWVVTAYVLLSGGLLLLGGRAADLLGRRRVLLAGLITFTAASLASGLATSPAWLVAARAAQGLGAALLTPSALAIVVTTYTGPQHRPALAAWGAIGSAGAAVGAVLGGALTSWLSWEWVFLVNVPVGAAAALLVPRLVPRTPRGAAGALDLPGAATLVGGLAVLVYALQGTAAHGWGSARTLLLLAAAAGLLAAFAVVERAAARPLVPPAVWRGRSLVSGTGLMLGATAVLAGTLFLASLHLQRTLGDTPLEAGLALLPIAVAIALGAHAAAHLLGHAGTRTVAAGGLALVAAGAALLALAPEHASYAADLLPGFLLAGLGTGLAFPAVSIAAMSEVDHEGAGLASGLMMTGHEVGAALGVAVLGAVAAGAAVGPAAGFGDGLTVAAALAGALALAALAALPAVRPAAGTRVALH